MSIFALYALLDIRKITNITKLIMFSGPFIVSGTVCLRFVCCDIRQLDPPAPVSKMLGLLPDVDF